MEQSLAKTSNPLLSVTKDGVLNYANDAAEPLLREWGVKVGGNLPSNLTDLVQRVISLDSPEKLEVKVGNKVYLVVFSPFPQKECISISGFVITEQREREEKIQENEEKYGQVAATTRNSNVTERKRMEEETRQRAEEVEAIMEVTPVAIWIGHDPQCNNITGNQMANEFYEAEVGENVSANITTERRFFHKGHELTSDELPMQKAASKNTDIRNEEIDILLPSGRHRTVLGSASPLHDTNGNVRGSVAAFIDITERKKAEAKLEKTLENLESLVKERTSELQKAYKSLKESEKGLTEAQRMAHIGSWVWDLLTDKISWSDELYRIFGLKPEEFDLSLDKILNYIHPDDRDHLCDAYQEALKGRNHSRDLREYRIISVNGKERVIHGRFEVIFNEENKPVQMRGTDQDVTELKKAEEALRSSETRFRSLYENSLDGILLTNPNGSILSANPQACSFFGMTEDEIIKAGRAGLVIKDEMFKAALEERSLTGRVKAELTLRRKDGSTFVGEASSNLFVDSDGITKSSLIIRDITKRKKAEEELIDSETRLKAYLDNSAIIAWMKDEKGHHTFLSSNCEKRFGVRFEDWCGKTDFDLWPREIAKKLRENDLAVLKSGKNLEIEEEVRNPDGSVSWWLNNKFLFVDSLGKKYVGGLGIDITGRRRAEEALRKSKEQYQTLFNSISEGFANYEAIYGEHGALYDLLVLEINPAGARLLEVEQEALIGKTWREIWPGVKEYLFEIYQKVDQTGKSVQFKSFSNITGRWQVTQIDRIAKGQFAVIFRDITEEKEAEKALAKYEIARKKEIHHRIKNNLQIISALLDLQAEKLKSRNDISISELLHVFKESQDRVLSMALIHEELYRGGETDKLNFSSYVGKLAENLILTYRVGNKDISLDLDLEENIFFDTDTAIPLGMIINELVSNSFKYAFQGRDKGKIKISLLRDENIEYKKEGYMSNAYILSVSDNGVGIPEDIDIENLDSLGLQLVTSLVDQLDGELGIIRSNGTETTVKFMVTEEYNPE